MAESIAILFKDVSWDLLCEELSQIADVEGIGKKYWKYPAANDEYTLSLYEYDSWLRECEPEEVLDITHQLGVEPSTVLCIELRRTLQEEACDHAEFVVRRLLEKYRGLVDDALDKYWSLEEIMGGGFLNEYRSNL